MAGQPAIGDFRRLFGDERTDDHQAIQRHHAEGAPSGWESDHVSAYATMRPWEDWAETFAHDLHIRDTLQTADEFGVVTVGPKGEHGRRRRDLTTLPSGRARAGAPFEVLIADWLPLTSALNVLHRSMGRSDLYPFVLAPAVIDKLAFIHGIVTRHGAIRPSTRHRSAGST